MRAHHRRQANSETTMYFTERLMLRQVDSEADTKIMLQWMNDPDMVLSPPGPIFPSSRQKVKTSMEKLADKEDKLPCLIICEKPTENGPMLGVDDDYFLTDDKKARFPAIGLLQVSNSRGYTHFNRCVTLGIALDREHRGRFKLSTYRSEASQGLRQCCY